MSLIQCVITIWSFVAMPAITHERANAHIARGSLPVFHYRHTTRGDTQPSLYLSCVIRGRQKMHQGDVCEIAY
ncbi:hypothetical protein F5J12DRAFT_803850 [Pisolithus orientalis]|uniref:uncharacterized protein n=1 Tax=Pisolithus orientalis TaxID=936130 RepID=UPI002224CF2C|nr:uncharacterized protein F5J12DRAFT_803850 [Pisolithus orientalis]KAI6030914.1 hypothetical protein F5J12DRAFT_803850 [Pisolithus orientalis]